MSWSTRDPGGGMLFGLSLSFIFLCVNVLWATKTQIKPWLKPSYLSPCSFMCLVYLSITLLHAHRQAEQSVNRVKSQTAWAPSAPAVPSWLVYMHTLIRSRCECNITFVFLFPISFNMLANQVMFNILPAHQRLHENHGIIKFTPSNCDIQMEIWIMRV